LFTELKRKRIPGRTICRCKSGLKLDLRELEGGGVDWTDILGDRAQVGNFVIAVMNLLDPQYLILHKTCRLRMAA
jgi:hypothetical protein